MNISKFIFNKILGWKIVGDFKEKELKKIPSWAGLVPMIKNMKENARYKVARTQANNLLKKVKALINQHAGRRPNVNYQAPEEAAAAPSWRASPAAQREARRQRILRGLD